MPTLRLDRVATMPGAVRSARTYSLILDGPTLYILDVGPAMGPKARVGGIAQWLADKMIARMETKTAAQVDAGIARLDAHGHEAIAGDKGSVRLGRQAIEGCEMGTNGWGRTSLKLKTAGRAFAFIAPPGAEADLAAFGEAVQAWAEAG